MWLNSCFVYQIGGWFDFNVQFCVLMCQENAMDFLGVLIFFFGSSNKGWQLVT